MKKSLILAFTLCIGQFFLNSTKASETLFTIDGTPTSKEEFEYIYKKNNINNQADYSKTSLDDYLKLFINYKLKVKQAYSLGLDTSAALMKEYDGYRKQLLDSYIQRHLIDPLIQQEYDRSQNDVAISHIFVSKSTPQSEQKIKEAYQKLKNGDKFEAVAKKYSEDSISAANGGKVGYFAALQIGYPQIEDALYNVPVGKYSDVITTDLGYHIIRVDATRPAYGRVKVAIIKMGIPTDKAAQLIIKNRMDSIYSALKAGSDFAQLAAKYSDDYNSNMKGGELEWFGINTYVKEFENAAFNIPNDGEISVPFATATSYYIIKRISKMAKLSFEESESVIKAKLMHSKMYEHKLNDFLSQLKSQYSYVPNNANLELFTKKVSALIDVYPFQFPVQSSPLELFSINGKSFNENQIGEAIKNNYVKVTGKLGEERTKALVEMSLNDNLMNVYEQLLADSLIEYSNLLDEYKNGVLIFELTKNQVWNKATTDSIGLEKFYNSLGNKYMWNERAEIIHLQTDSSISENGIAKLIKKQKLNTQEAWSAYIQKNPKSGISFSHEIIEKGDTTHTPINWNLGLHADEQGHLYQTLRLIPAHRKSLSDVRGYVVAAYQEYLDQEWIKHLHQKYDVKINKDVLQSMVK